MPFHSFMTSMLCSGSVGHGQPKRAARRMPGSDIAPIHSSGDCGSRREVALDLEVLALVVERLPRPQPLQDLDRLLEARDLLLLVEAEEVELGREGAEADAELQAPAGEHVDHRRVLGDVDRVLERQQVHRRADVDARRQRRQRAQRRPRGRQVGVGHHVVLGQEERRPSPPPRRPGRRPGSPASAGRCAPRSADPAAGTAVRTSSRLLLADAADGIATNERLVIRRSGGNPKRSNHCADAKATIPLTRSPSKESTSIDRPCRAHRALR